LHLKLLTIVTILVFCFTSTALAFAQNDDKIVIFHTEFGHLAIELFSDDAPNTAESFLKLAESSFYDDTIFHRILKDFMIQGGDPNTKEHFTTSYRDEDGKKVVRNLIKVNGGKAVKNMVVVIWQLNLTALNMTVG